jgi:hypothetical protein
MSQQIRHVGREAEHAGVVSVNENGLLTEMVTDRDTTTCAVADVGDVTSAAAP